MNADKFKFYTDKKGQHRWRRTAPNGKIVGASSEGYKNKIDCVKNAVRNGFVADDKIIEDITGISEETAAELTSLFEQIRKSAGIVKANLTDNPTE